MFNLLRQNSLMKSLKVLYLLLFTCDFFVFIITCDLVKKQKQMQIQRRAISDLFYDTTPGGHYLPFKNKVKVNVVRGEQAL